MLEVSLHLHILGGLCTVVELAGGGSVINGLLRLDFIRLRYIYKYLFSFQDVFRKVSFSNITLGPEMKYIYIFLFKKKGCITSLLVLLCIFA